MIEDILKANPGMRETYRAYARESVLKRRIDALEKQRDTVANGTAGKKALATIEADLAKCKEALTETRIEVRRCEEFEKSRKLKAELVR